MATTTTENITRSVYGAYLQSSLFTGQDFQLVQNTSLNEKFLIQAGILPSSGNQPTLKYYAIGNGGHTMAAGTNGVVIPTPVQHQATDAALYKHLPFVLRLVTNDLTAAQQANYGLRTQVTIDGTVYIAYYLKVIDYSTTQVAMQTKVVNSDGTTTTTSFVPTAANLSPTPPALSSTGVNLTTGNYVTATAKITIVFDEDDITELLNVANIMFGDEDYAIISEIAMVSAVKQVTSYNNGGTTSYNFTEALVAQVCAFINTMIPVKFLNSSVSIALDLGASEPLSSVTVASS